MTAGTLFSANRTRLTVVGAICIAYLLAFLPLLVLPDGPWLIMLLAASSWPLLLFAIALAMVFATKIITQPWRWSLAASISAIVLSCLTLQLFAGQGTLGLIGLPIAVLAPVIFNGALKAFTPAAPPADNSAPRQHGCARSPLRPPDPQ